MTNNRPSDEATADSKIGETLLPDELRRRLPPLHSTDRLMRIGHAVARVRFFTPWFQGFQSWYVAEFDGEDILWGLYKPTAETPWYRSFSLRELEGKRDIDGLRVKRDLHFQPIRLGDLYAALCAWEG